MSGIRARSDNEQTGVGDSATGQRTVTGLFDGMGPITLIDSEGHSSELTAAELVDESARLAGGLASLGMGAGDRIGVWLPNGRAYLSLLAACARLGLVAVAVNTRFRAAEVQDIVGRSGCRLLFVQPGFVGIDTEGILGRLDKARMPSLETVVSVAGPVTSEWPTVPYDDLVDGPPLTRHPGHRDAPYAVFTTSGTTSAPKLVLHHQASIADHAHDAARAFGYTAADVSLLALPLCGVFGLTSFVAAAAAGAAQVVTAVFDPAVASEAVATKGVSVMNATDDMVHRLLVHGGDWAGVRMTGYGRFNNALDDLPDRARDAGLTLVGLYGMSEVLALFAGRGAAAPPGERERMGGRLVSPRAEARVVDPTTGRAVDPGVEGELQLRGPSRFAGYLATGGAHIDPELTGRHLTDDGWFRTGDLARMEGPDSFEYLARMGDVLRLGGFLVSPAEIEDRLLEVAGIDAAQVVAVDTERGPVVAAFVLGPVDRFDEAEAIEHCRAQLAPFKVPRMVLRLDGFPVTESANGLKIQKVRLRQLAEEHLAHD